MLSYRAYFAVPGEQDLIERAEEQLTAWLRSKRYDADRLFEDGLQTIGVDVTGSVLRAAPRDGSHSFRARIDEGRPDSPRWTTELTVHKPHRGDTGWIWLDVSGPDAGPPAAPPRLAGALLDVLPAYDGDLRISSTPQLIGADDVDALVAALVSDGRRGLAFVAGSSAALPMDKWCELVAKLLHRTNGLASGYVLDVEATQRFARAVGEAHAVAPATVRTFQPWPILGDAADALRHRTLSTDRIARDSTGRLAHILGRRASDLALGSPLPRDAQRLDQLLRRQLDDRLVADARPRPVFEVSPTAVKPPVPVDRSQPEDQSGTAPVAPIAPPVVAPLKDQRQETNRELRVALGNLMADLTGSQQVTMAAIEQLAALQTRLRSEVAAAVARDAAVDQLQARIRDLETAYDIEREQRHLAESLYEDEQLERAIAEQDRAAAQRHLRALQQRLAPTDLDGSVWIEPAVDPVDVPPESMDDLLARLRANELDHLEFTGDDAPALALDEHHLTGIYARKGWEALLALQDYAAETAAGRCPRDVEGHLQQLPPHCHPWPASRHARSESSDVQQNKKYASVRVFAVPAEVDASGRSPMWAHFKLGQSGMTSPRLHYLDATAKDGKIYVGYIGAHLPTGQTN